MATHRPIRGLLHRLDHPLALWRWEMSFTAVFVLFVLALILIFTWDA